MRAYPIHEDFRNLKFAIPMHPALLLLSHPVTKLLYRMQGIGRGISYRRRRVGSRGKGGISLGIYMPLKAAGPLPCLFFIHGGGFAFHAVGYHREIICDYVRSSGCAAIDVEYRLLPRFPFPCALEDCDRAFSWLRENAEGLGIDGERIAFCGDSAGAALAAGLTQLLRDRDRFKPLFQMLVCPVLDSGQASASMKRYDDTPVWNSRTNGRMWGMYLRKADGASLRPYASPLANPDLAGLPPAYVEVSEFDCLRDEGIEYARRLRAAGIEVTLNETVGTVHGFELCAKSAYRDSLLGRRREYLIQGFARGLPRRAT